MKGEQTWGAKMHLARQTKEKKIAKKKRESFRNYDEYSSSKYCKGILNDTK